MTSLQIDSLWFYGKVIYYVYITYDYHIQPLHHDLGDVD